MNNGKQINKNVEPPRVSDGINIVFMSNDEFGIPAFKKLTEDQRFKISSVVTIHDKPKGRHCRNASSPIKNLALKHKIMVIDADNIKNAAYGQKIKNQNPDIIVVASFGQIIPKSILNIPKHGALNIHPSILPKYRGPSPIQSAILNGEKATGVTIMLMDEKMDHGPIIANSEFKITNPKTIYKELRDRLANLGAELITKTIPDWIAGKINPLPQDHSKATFTKKITKEDGHINWNEEAEIIERKIRAYQPWPGAYSFYQKSPSKNVRIIFLEADVISDIGNRAGEVFKIDGVSRWQQSVEKTRLAAINKTNKLFAVQTGKGALKIERIKPEGKKEMDAQDFLKGNSEVVGTIFC
jgi:methionyl-tRNA formyltransferase